MALGEAQQSGNTSLFDIVHHTADGARLFEPVALPEFSGPDALVLGGLEVFAAGHGAAVDGVDDAGLYSMIVRMGSVNRQKNMDGGSRRSRGETVTHLAVEPHLILPLLWLARLHVLGIVIVNQVDILDIPVESCFIETHCDKTADCTRYFFFLCECAKQSNVM